MELLKYHKRHQTAFHSSFDQHTEKWFGSKSFLKTEVNRGIQVNSFDKEVKNKRLKNSKFDKLISDLSKAREKVAKINLLKAKIKFHADGFKLIRSLNDENSDLFKKMNQAAIKIQKVARGFLTRKLTNDKILQVYRNSVNEQLGKISQSDYFCLFFVGKKAKEAAIMIQRFTRRFQMRQKLARMKKFYLTVLRAKEVEKAYKMRTHFVMLLNNLILKEAKAGHEVSKKLLKIKRKLAILKIKSILKLKNIKLKSIKHRIRRFTKKQSMGHPSLTTHILTQSPLALEKNLSLNDSKHSSHPNNEDQNHSNHYSPPSPHILHPPSMSQNLNLQDHQANHEKSIDNFSFTTEYLAAQEALKKERVEKGKITYNIKTKPPSLILPLFQDYDPDSRPQTTRSTMNRTNLSRPLRVVPESTPRKRIQLTKEIFFTARNYKARKYGEDEEPPYMKDTKNSELRYEETPSPEPRAEPRALLMNSRVLTQTYSSSQKVKVQLFETPKPSKKSSRPSTGPRILRRVIKSKPQSCANITDYPFDPPLAETTDLESQSFRPFYVKVRPALERLKLNHSRYFSQF